MALARALFHWRSLLILDEATASLDKQDEARIQENIRALAQGRTVIVIAHRLSALRDVDRVICLERGKIIEQGTPADLALGGGYFADMVRGDAELVRDLAGEHPPALTGQGTREKMGNYIEK